MVFGHDSSPKQRVGQCCENAGEPPARWEGYVPALNAGKMPAPPIGHRVAVFGGAGILPAYARKRMVYITHPFPLRDNDGFSFDVGEMECLQIRQAVA